MEMKTYDFYKKHGNSAKYPAEKEFYEKLSEEEQTHQLVLLDYYEYIKDPAGWFVNKEHTSLDGG
jgi:rubrerythrin